MFVGCRFQILKAGRQIRFFSKAGTYLSSRLPLLSEAFRGIPAQSAVIDGQLCLLDVGGVPEFHGLRQAIREDGRGVHVFAFDLMHINGIDYTSRPLIDRKQRLARLIANASIANLHLVDAFSDGVDLLQAVEQGQLAGIVSKRREAPYRSGLCRDWLKVRPDALR